MTTFERIKKLADKKDKSLQEVAEINGFSPNLFYRWKTSSAKGKDLSKVADYFDVSTDYLLCRTDDPTPPDKNKPKVSESDLDNMLDKASSFNGRPLDDHDRSVIKGIIKGYYSTK